MNHSKLIAIALLVGSSTLNSGCGLAHRTDVGSAGRYFFPTSLEDVTAGSAKIADYGATALIEPESVARR